MGITAGKQSIEANNTRHKEVSLLAKSSDYINYESGASTQGSFLLGHE
jgi:hypothetical protein